MNTKLETKKHDLLKQLDKATGKRDDAIKALIKQTGQITMLQRAVARTDKRIGEERAAARKAAQLAKKGPPPEDATAPLDLGAPERLRQAERAALKDGKPAPKQAPPKPKRASKAVHDNFAAASGSLKHLVATMSD